MSPYIEVMELHPTTLERAFALAKSGTCSGVGDIRRRLQEEGYSPHALEGPVLLRQLRDLCVAASGRGAGDQPVQADVACPDAG